MRIIVEVVADDRDDAAALLRDVATKIKRGKEDNAREVNNCIGDYRVLVYEATPDAAGDALSETLAAAATLATQRRGVDPKGGQHG